MSNGEHTTYRPSQVVIRAGGVYLWGWDSVDAEMASDAYTKKVGTSGSVCRVEIVDPSGRITVKTMQSSAVNAQLQTLARRTTKFSVMVKDNSGNDVAHASKAWIAKPPKIEKGKDDAILEWPFDCADLVIDRGGNSE